MLPLTIMASAPDWNWRPPPPPPNNAFQNGPGFCDKLDAEAEDAGVNLRRPALAKPPGKGCDVMSPGGVAELEVLVHILGDPAVHLGLCPQVGPFRPRCSSNKQVNRRDLRG